MSPHVFSCVLCGYVMYDLANLNLISWLKQIRILYSSRNGIAVTGVGLYTGTFDNWIAPLDFTARWDDAGYNFPTRDQIGMIQQHPVTGRYGFPFHEACWSLLEKAYSPEPIPCKALFEICRSLPSPSKGTGLSWGHDSGGLILVDNQDRYPWEDRFVDTERRGGDCAPGLAPRSDPYHVPEILQVLFRANADRSWLLESHDWAKEQDWRWLYRRTNKAHRTRGTQNRERVWKLIQHVRGTLRLRWSESAVLPSPIPNPASLMWFEATGDLRPQGRTGLYHSFNEGCRLFREQQTSIPSLLYQIAFSIIPLGDAEYIAGMRLIPSQGEDIQLGYRTEGRELFLNITFLGGFNLAVGSRGIQGIQCIADDKQSAWFGCPHEAPRTRRLAARNRITAIKAGFDGCKMVSLAIVESVPLTVEKAIEDKPLRDSAFWYPQIPGIGLYLNDGYFVARDSSTTRYQPLCRTMFGGPGGIYLSYLTGISVTYWGELCGIEFHYNTENVPIECRKLGRYKSSEYDKVIHFSIDGPGGEVIDATEVYLKYYPSEKVLWFYKHGTWESFKASHSYLKNDFDTPRSLQMTHSFGLT
ncbi:uncharacterized protein BP5553_03128 [Venustampulla echinocandica]|uniref:DUF7600 domain-containing protein n=1 Tax=Venustampulla echinocandica TaxID=2656787 RepID=A0A370TTH2_9HELO|nr:uncharacterized protein BP5553_03128 [Venustampulla echinocandica]RDL38788.1 hypothetical protein BP5553_03128 [Venustampulla echinocandica]